MKEDILSERQRKHFNSIETSYEKAVNDPKARYYRKLVYKLFFHGTSLEKLMHGGKDFLVLEAMCGDGMGKRVIKEIYANAEFEYEGFDYSEEMVKEAKRKYPDSTFYQQDVKAFDPDKKYDVVMLLSGLHHVPDSAVDVMKKMHLALKDGGVFVSVEPTYNLSFFGWFGDRVYKHSKFYDYDSERRFSFKELNGIFNKSGFEIEKQIYPGLLGYLLWWFNPYPKLLKIGDLKTVRRLYRIEEKLYCNTWGRRFSLATFTILKKRFHKF